MPTTIETTAPASLASADLTPRGHVHPSPADWRDQTFYFLLPDRFSDASEASRPLFDSSQPHVHQAQDKAAWMQAGTRFQGGTLKGVQSKLGYLKELGVTALWIGPVWKQRKDLETYHGYGIQHFLDIDPRFGSRQDLRDLVDAAHAQDMYVILDIIYNHSGNNWFYADNGQPKAVLSYRYSPPYELHSWRSASGSSTGSITTAEEGVWPEEFQDHDWYTRAGRIGKWDPEAWEDPLHPDNEFRRGDFFDLKDLNLNRQEVLSGLIKVYQYWIALSDCDGFRVDTVKHVSWEASRNFCGAIHEYAESIGKQHFLLLGEVTGGAGMAKDYLEIFGRNLDAVLDIGDPARRIEETVKGLRAAQDFFIQFTGHDTLGTHRETGRYHVSILDDHDMVGRTKQRFAAHNTIASLAQQVAHAVGFQLTTLGIPCIYYGTEQAFDGSLHDHDTSIEPADEHGKIPFDDRYIREAMFGGTFGAFETAGCHFFDTHHPTYIHIAAMGRIRNRKDMTGLALRRGRQYQREISFLGKPFALYGPGELTAWSRIQFNQEVLMVLNTHGTAARGADITIDAALHQHTATMTFLYRSDWDENQLQNPPADQTVAVQQQHGRTTVHVDLPAAGMAVLV